MSRFCRAQRGVALAFASALIFSSAISLAGCAQATTPSTKADSSAYAALKDKLRALTQPAKLTTNAATAMTDTEVAGSTTTEPDTTGVDSTGTPVVYKTTTTKYTASAAYDTNALLNPSSDVIYPGSVILGSSIDDGSYKEITTGTKRPITISFDLSGVKKSETDSSNGNISGTITPTLSTYRELKNQILAQKVPKQTSTYSMEKTEIHSEEEMNLKVNAGASYAGGSYEVSIKTGFSYDKSNTTNKLMIKFMQTFYTVDVDQGSDTFLFSDFDVNAFNGYRPVYVSSIAYGRLAYLTIESTQSITNIEANLDAAFKAGGTSADVSVSNAQKWLKSNTTTNITVIGGSTVATDLGSFITMLSNDSFSEDNCGKIIAYKLRFVDDNTVASTIFNGDYTVRKVTAVAGKGVDVSFQFTHFKCDVDDGDGDNCEPYGSLKVSSAGTDKYLWQIADSDAWMTDEQSDKDVSGTPQSFHFDSTTASVNIELSLWENDGKSGDDTYSPGNASKSVSELVPSGVTPADGVAFTGSPITLRSHDLSSSSEYMEFTITPTITYHY